MEILENASLKTFNTLGVEVLSRYLVKLQSTEDVTLLLENQSLGKRPLMILGGGSNVLFRDNFPGTIALNRFTGVELIEENSEFAFIRVAAGENWHKLVRHSLAHNWYGLENLSLIPGLVGATPVQNIGAYGVEIADHFHSLNAIDLLSGEHKVFNKLDCNFGYRDSIFKTTKAANLLITDITLKLLKKPNLILDYPGIKSQLKKQQATPLLISDIVTSIRQAKLPDPDQLANVGSFFKNPIISNRKVDVIKDKHPGITFYPLDAERVKVSAAWLIDQCGWKGYRSGDAGVSPQHALVLVNYGHASGRDIWKLAESIINSVYDKFSIQLSAEPRIL